MQRPAKPEPMIATPTSRTAPEGCASGVGWASSVLVTDRLLLVLRDATPAC